MQVRFKQHLFGHFFDTPAALGEREASSCFRVLMGYSLKTLPDYP